MSTYQPEPYWSEVAERIEGREDLRIIAGDDEPYYRYKREKFLRMLDKIKLSGKTVLELGPGPGGNLKYLSTKDAAKLQGVDISSNMIALAGKNLAGLNIDIKKTDGKTIPLEDQSYDIVFTATVLQHNTNEEMLKGVIKELTRVCKEEFHIYENIMDPIAGDELCLGRPVGYYQKMIEQHGFKLVETQFINIHFSYLVCGAIRKLLNPKTRKEGEPLNGISIFLQKLTLPVTKILDNLFPKSKHLGRLSFKRI